MTCQILEKRCLSSYFGTGTFSLAELYNREEDPQTNINSKRILRLNDTGNDLDCIYQLELCPVINIDDDIEDFEPRDKTPISTKKLPIMGIDERRHIYIMDIEKLEKIEMKYNFFIRQIVLSSVFLLILSVFNFKYLPTVTAILCSLILLVGAFWLTYDKRYWRDRRI